MNNTAEHLNLFEKLNEWNNRNKPHFFKGVLIRRRNAEYQNDEALGNGWEQATQQKFVKQDKSGERYAVAVNAGDPKQTEYDVAISKPAQEVIYTTTDYRLIFSDSKIEIIQLGNDGEEIVLTPEQPFTEQDVHELLVLFNTFSQALCQPEREMEEVAFVANKLITLFQEKKKQMAPNIELGDWQRRVTSYFYKITRAGIIHINILPTMIEVLRKTNDNSLDFNYVIEQNGRIRGENPEFLFKEFIGELLELTEKIKEFSPSQSDE